MPVGAHPGVSPGARLLAGPRGRRLCLELVAAGSSDVRGMLFHLGYAADVHAGATRLVAFVGERVDGSALDDQMSAASIDRLVQLIGATRVSITPAAIEEALVLSVGAARYWQPPDGWDVLAADARVTAALTAVADRVVRHPASRWWRRDIADTQWALAFDGEPAMFDPAPDAAGRWAAATRAEEDRARERRLTPAGQGFSGHWWSHPWGAPHTTGELPDGLPAGLAYVEDALGWTQAEAIPVAGTGRIHEVRTAADWAHLCRRYPLEVTAARRHDWFRTTGRDGRWLLPEWSRVAQEWDGVHLTGWAYLTAATRAIEVDDEYASLIGGWGPDETYWLTGRVRELDVPRVPWRASDGPAVSSWTRA